jgi:hypothetical protein
MIDLLGACATTPFAAATENRPPEWYACGIFASNTMQNALSILIDLVVRSPERPRKIPTYANNFLLACAQEKSFLSTLQPSAPALIITSHLVNGFISSNTFGILGSAANKHVTQITLSFFIAYYLIPETREASAAPRALLFCARFKSKRAQHQPDSRVPLSHNAPKMLTCSWETLFYYVIIYTWLHWNPFIALFWTNNDWGKALRNYNFY